VVDDAIDHREVGEESDDLHRAPALGTKEANILENNEKVFLDAYEKFNEERSI